MFGICKQSLTRLCEIAAVHGWRQAYNKPTWKRNVLNGFECEEAAEKEIFQRI